MNLKSSFFQAPVTWVSWQPSLGFPGILKSRWENSYKAVPCSRRMHPTATPRLALSPTRQEQSCQPWICSSALLKACKLFWFYDNFQKQRRKCVAKETYGAVERKEEQRYLCLCIWYVFCPSTPTHPHTHTPTHPCTHSSCPSAPTHPCIFSSCPSTPTPTHPRTHTPTEIHRSFPERSR